MQDQEVSKKLELIQTELKQDPAKNPPPPKRDSDHELKIKHTLKLEEIQKIPVQKDKIVYFEKEKRIEDFKEFYIKKTMTNAFLIQCAVITFCLCVQQFQNQINYDMVFGILITYSSL